MEYDFTTLVNRHPQSSAKWGQMKERLPDISDDIAPFSVADMDLKNAPQIIDGLIDYLRKDAILGYTSPYDGYYQAVISWMARRHHWTVERDWIVPANGVVPAVFDLIKAFAPPAGGVVLMTPVYYPFYRAVKANGRRVVECPLIDNNGRYEMDFDLFDRLTQAEENKLLVFCSPHNPVGRVWSREELARLADICVKNGVVVVSDEIHNDLIMPGCTHTVMATLGEAVAKQVITCTAPSKTFNLAGMQTANIIVSDPELRERYRAEQVRSGFSGLNALGYRTCEIAYNQCEDWLEQLIALVWHNYQTLVDFMAKHLPQVKVYPLEGTYLPWMDFRGLGMDKDTLETFMIEKANVFMDEGYIFGEAGAGFERMDIACPTDVMVKALERIVKAL